MSKRKKIEFSKIIMITVGTVTLAVTVFTCVMIWRTSDLSPLAYLIPAIFAEAGVGTGFYYNKAKIENQIKLRKQHGSDIYNDIKGDNYND